MILKELILENIRSYKKQTIHFKEGSTLICGDIGSGKSTILMSIEFGIFGVIKGNIEPLSLLRRGQKEALISIKLKSNNQEITITRFLKKTDKTVKQLPAHLIINNTKEILTPIELQSKIEEIIGHPKTSKNLLFRYATYTPQEDMKKIIFEDEQTRMNIIRKIFDIDKYSKIKENINKYSKELRYKLRIKEEKINDFNNVEQDISQKNEALDKLKQNILKTDEIYQNKLENKKTNQIQLENLQNENSKLQENKNEIEYQIKDLLQKENEIKQNKLEIKNNNEKIDKLKEKLKTIKIIDIDTNSVALKAEISSLQNKINTTLKDQEIISNQIKNNEKIIEQINKSLKEISNKIDEQDKIDQELKQIEEKISLENKFKEKLQNLEKIRQSTQKELTQIDTQIQLEEKSTNEIKQLSSCPTCKQTINDEYKKTISKNSKDTITTLRNKKSILIKDIEEQEIKIPFLKNKLEEIIALKQIKKNHQEKLLEINTNKENKNKLNQELEKQNQEYLKQTKDLEQLKKIDVTKIKETLVKQEQRLEIIQKNNENKIIKENLENNIQNILQINNQLTNKMQSLVEQVKNLNEINLQKKILTIQIEKIIPKLDNIKKELNKQEKELQETYTQKINFKKDLEYLKKEITELNDKLLQKNKITKEISNIKNKHTWLNSTFFLLIEKIEKQVFLKIHERFNSRFQEWFNIIIEDEDITSKIDENFTPKINVQGYDAQINTLSGGEKTSVALAYRLALNKIINELISKLKTQDLLILDEPTDGFSTQQLDKMREVLDKINSKQMILVSHENKIESYVENIIRLQKENHSTNIIEN